MGLFSWLFGATSPEERVAAARAHLATGEYTPETGVFTFRIEGFRSDASSVAAQAAAILALRVPGWQSLSADQRDALVGTTEALVAGGQTLIEAAVSAAEMFATGGASAVVPGN